MNIIFKIAKAEWKNLFYSPVAWLVLFVFCIACGAAFVLPLDRFWRIQRFSLEVDALWPGFNGVGLTKLLISGPGAQLAKQFFLFIPLLTMGIINREVTNGTIKLLYSSPVRVRDIVLGKYLGVFSFIMILIIFVASIFAVIPALITDADPRQYISSVLGIFLLASSYISIGIFISSLTTYQIVAGVLTFIVFFSLNAVGGLWQQYDFVRDITYFLNISGRVDVLLEGLITSRDVSYFILITILFLGLTLIKLKSTQESRPWTVSFKRYALVSAIVLIVGYLTSIPGKILYWDVTAQKVNTVHPETQAVIAEMDGSPLTVTLYTNLFGINAKEGLPQNRNFYVWKIWDKYRRFYPNMIFKYEYYYDVREGDKSLYTQHPGMNLQQIRDKFAKEFGVRASLFKGPEQIRNLISFNNEEMRLVMKLDYKGRTAWLRTFEDPTIWHSENTFCGTIKRLTRKAPPHIFYTTGNYERSPYRIGDREYFAHTTYASSREALVNHGVDCDTISLSRNEIPLQCDLLVLADPKSKLTLIEEQRINNYLSDGRNALILGEPGKQKILDPILNPIGAKLSDGIIVNTKTEEMPHVVDAVINDAGAFMSDEPDTHLYRLYRKEPVTTRVIGATIVSYRDTSGFTIEPVLELQGDNNKWLEKGHLVTDSAAPVFSRKEGDVRMDRYELVVKMNRLVDNKEQRIVVAADADLLSKDRIGRQGLSYYSWLLYNKYPTYINMMMPNDVYLKANPATIKAVSWTYAYVIPALVLMAGVIVLIRRKKK